MAKKEEQKLLYKAILPSVLHIEIHKAEEGGYWAKTKEIPCYSQGEKFWDLFNILTKAIYAYYNVPEKFISELGTYIPVISVQESVRANRPKIYTLDDILKKNPEKIQELQRV